MASLIDCPHCGARPKEEFAIKGAVSATARAGCRAPRTGWIMSICATTRAGAYREYWHHASGAGAGWS